MRTLHTMMSVRYRNENYQDRFRKEGETINNKTENEDSIG